MDPHLPTNIPIIGEPKVLDFSVTMVVECICKAPLLVIGKAGVIVQCLACTRQIRIGGISLVEGQDGKFALGYTAPTGKVGG